MPRDIDAVEAAVEGYRAARIPLEVAWTDIDYMAAYKDFTFDGDRFPVDRLSAFVARLAAAGQRWVPIVDVGIADAPHYDARFFAPRLRADSLRRLLRAGGARGTAPSLWRARRLILRGRQEGAAAASAQVCAARGDVRRGGGRGPRRGSDGPSADARR